LQDANGPARSRAVQGARSRELKLAMRFVAAVDRVDIPVVRTFSNEARDQPGQF
jgi:hypothetical protein